MASKINKSHLWHYHSILHVMRATHSIIEIGNAAPPPASLSSFTVHLAHRTISSVHLQIQRRFFSALRCTSPALSITVLHTYVYNSKAGAGASFYSHISYFRIPGKILLLYLLRVSSFEFRLLSRPGTSSIGKYRMNKTHRQLQTTRQQ